MHALDGFARLLRCTQLQDHVDSPNHQHAIVIFYFASRIRGQTAVACIDFARLQRAPEGSSQSTRRCGDNVIEGGRMGFEDFRRHFVVLRYCAVYSEENGGLFCRQPRAPQGAFHTLDPHTRYVRCIRHVDHDRPRSHPPHVRPQSALLTKATLIGVLRHHGLKS